jgi:hypothetical protein
LSAWYQALSTSAFSLARRDNMFNTSIAAEKAMAA